MGEWGRERLGRKGNLGEGRIAFKIFNELVEMEAKLD